MSNQTQTAQNSKTNAAKKPPVQASPEKKGSFTNEQLREIGTAAPKDIGDLEEVTSSLEIPTFQAGKPGFETGETKRGYFLGTKTVLSTKQKKSKWKQHPGSSAGVVFRLQHKFLTADGTVIGIWNAGMLDNTCKNVRRPGRDPLGNASDLPQYAKGQYLEVTYTGLAEASLKEGDNAPHTFKYKSNEELVGGGSDVDDDAVVVAATEAAVN